MDLLSGLSIICPFYLLFFFWSWEMKWNADEKASLNSTSTLIICYETALKQQHFLDSRKNWVHTFTEEYDFCFTHFNSGRKRGKEGAE